jgi:hypothetical protein
MAVVLLAHRRRLGTQNNGKKPSSAGGFARFGRGRDNQAHPSGKESR